MIRVCIADNSMELCTALRSFLSALPDMQVVGIADDGSQALAQIEAQAPDVVVLDIILPGLDGMAVMEHICGSIHGKKPQVIAHTALDTETVMQRLMELGASYFLIKPCSFHVVANRIREFAGRSEKSLLQDTRASYNSTLPCEEESLVARLLHEIGAPPHFKGYNYLRDAVMMAAQGDGATCIFARHIYPRLAEKYGATLSAIEAAIRNSVVACWEGGNREYLSRLTGSAGASRKTFPANTVVITRLAEEIRAARRLRSDKQAGTSTNVGHQ